MAAGRVVVADGVREDLTLAGLNGVVCKAVLLVRLAVPA